MRRAVFALLLCYAAVAAAQLRVSDEVVSDPLRPHRSAPPFAAPAVDMARDRLGVAIAWSMPGADGVVERVYVARLDGAGHVAGSVREIAATLPQTDAVAPSIAANPSGAGFTVAWAENWEVVYCTLDAALMPSAPVRLSLTSTAPLVRSGPSSQSVWIAAGAGVWRIAPDGGRELFPGLVASDMTVATGFPQLVGARLTKVPIAGACSCPVPGGPFRGFCPSNCLIYLGRYTIDFMALPADKESRDFVSLTDAQPAIAGDANNVTVAWLEGDQASGGSAKASRVPLSSPGSFSSARTLTLGPFAPDAGVTRPAVASDGEQALVVWRVQRSPGDHDVAAAIVDNDGNVTPLSIAASPADERDPSVLALGHGAFLVAYEKIEAGQRRIAGRFVTVGRARAVR